MSRLTEKELAALALAKTSPAGFDEMQLLMAEARRMQAEVIAKVLRRALDGFGRLLGVPALRGSIGRWLRYRRTLAELSALDDRELADVGIARGEVVAAAREAAGVPRRHRLAAKLTGLIQAVRQARSNERVAQELSLLNDHLLRDIGVEPDQLGIAAEILTAQAGASQRKEPTFLGVPAEAPQPSSLPEISGAKRPVATGQALVEDEFRPAKAA